MAILEKEVIIGVSSNLHYLETLGYEIPKVKNKDGKLVIEKGTKIKINVNDLTDASNIKVTKVCDSCNKKIPKQSYNTIMRQRNFNGGKDYCFICGNQNSGKTRSLNIEGVHTVIINHGLKPLFNNYSSTNTKLLCETKEGYRVVPTLDNIKANKSPRIFSKSNPHTIENIRHFLLINNIDYKILSNEFLSAGKDKLNWECPNNHHFPMSWDVFKKGHRCPECNESKGEKEIRNILDSYSIEYITQYDDFEELTGVGGFKLRFDFALINDGMLITLIEYDGKFHFGKQYENDNYEILIEHDRRKNQYCLKNNINLERIPYWEFDNLKHVIKNILLKNKLI